jgi:hypothetical protein
MPRAGVHARRDLAPLQATFAACGLAPPPGLGGLLLARHRVLDTLTAETDADLHFMRGYAEEGQAEAFDRALAHLRRRAWRGATGLAAAAEAPGDPELAEAAALALADACHAVRDSYSRGHAVRAPGPDGPEVQALHCWERARRPHLGFGLVHALAHDLRFEAPFAARAPEVAASDRAVAAMLAVVARAARTPAPGRARAFETGWDAFARRHFAPTGPARLPPAA